MGVVLFRRSALDVLRNGSSGIRGEPFYLRGAALIMYCPFGKQKEG